MAFAFLKCGGAFIASLLPTYQHSEVMNKYPMQDEVAYTYHGITHSVIGDYQKALGDFNAAQQIEPNSPDIYSNRGIALYNMGENEKAIDDLNRYLQSRGNDANAIYFRDMANYRANHIDAAKQDLLRAPS